MRSGLLVERVDLLRKSSTQNSFGEMVQSWNKIKSLKCYVHRNSGRETLVNNEVIDITKIRIQLRNQYDIKEQDRIVDNSTLYKIDLIKPLDIKKRFIMLYCSRLNE